MRPPLDSDVLLDVAEERQPHVTASAAVLDGCEAHPASAAMAWHSVANLYYLLRKSQGDAEARQFIRELLGYVEVIATGTAEAKHAMALPMSDFEDALQVAAAVAGGMDTIVTRNTSDYASSPVRAMTPEQFLDGAPP